ncbi:hypothetical protein ACLNGM_11270 [Aureimonas phyllosphaerae]|uniref:hypothetical protein n=1 Tax=Aureimonas phyllosphaerae TaxID=1166078 RepID=UPI003A5C0001
MKTTIRVHPIRAKQLTDFAASVSDSVPRVIDWFVSRLMETGALPDQIEEFTVHRVDDAVRITLGGYALPQLTVDEADRLGLALVQFVMSPGRIMRHTLPAGHSFVAQRAGQGIRLSVHANQTVPASITATMPILVDVLRNFEKLSQGSDAEVSAPA